MPRRDPVGDRFVALNGTVGPHRPISAWWISLSPVTSKFALSSAIFMSVLLTSYSPEANVSIVIVASLNPLGGVRSFLTIYMLSASWLHSCPNESHYRPFGLLVYIVIRMRRAVSSSSSPILNTLLMCAVFSAPCGSSLRLIP